VGDRGEPRAGDHAGFRAVVATARSAASDAGPTSGAIATPGAGTFQPMNLCHPRKLGVVAAILFAAGCGYQNGGGGSSGSSTITGSGASPTASGNSANVTPGFHWSSVYRQDVRTVAIPIFKSNSYERGVEFALSKALVNQIEAKTPYKVVPRERADTILEGEIVAVNANTLSKDTHAGIPQEQILDITVDFTWKDLRTGRILVARRGVEQTATWYPTLGEGRTIGDEQVTERLAISIVQELQADW
jgi:hypothetical protein